MKNKIMAILTIIALLTFASPSNAEETYTYEEKLTVASLCVGATILQTDYNQEVSETALAMLSVFTGIPSTDIFTETMFILNLAMVTKSNGDNELYNVLMDRTLLAECIF